MARPPPQEQWPQLVYDLSELQFPPPVNLVRRLLDDAVEHKGWGSHILLRSNEHTLTYAQALDEVTRIARVLVPDLGEPLSDANITMPMVTTLQPPGWVAPKGYTNGVSIDLQAGSRLVFVGGQIGWNTQQQFDSDDFIAQCRQTLLNVRAILECAGAGPEHMARMTCYVLDRLEYSARLSNPLTDTGWFRNATA